LKDEVACGAWGSIDGSETVTAVWDDFFFESLSLVKPPNGDVLPYLRLVCECVVPRDLDMHKYVLEHI
jgi:hypothetical protein